MYRGRVPTITRVVLTIVKWSPVLAAWFAIFMTETALQLRIRANDYIIREQRRLIREAKTHINLLEAEEDEREAMDLIEAKAKDMGLIEPLPDQIELLYVVGMDNPAEGAGRELVDVTNGVLDIASLSTQSADPPYETDDSEEASWHRE